MARRALRGGGRRPLPAGRSGDPAGAAAAALARDGGGGRGARRRPAAARRSPAREGGEAQARTARGPGREDAAVEALRAVVAVRLRLRLTRTASSGAWEAHHLRFPPGSP